MCTFTARSCDPAHAQFIILEKYLKSKLNFQQKLNRGDRRRCDIASAAAVATVAAAAPVAVVS